MKKTKISHLGVIEAIHDENGSILLRTLIFMTLFLLIASSLCVVHTFSIRRAAELQERVEVLISNENKKVLHEIQ